MNLYTQINRTNYAEEKATGQVEPGVWNAKQRDQIHCPNWIELSSNCGYQANRQFKRVG